MIQSLLESTVKKEILILRTLHTNVDYVTWNWFGLQMKTQCSNIKLDTWYIAETLIYGAMYLLQTTNIEDLSLIKFLIK